MIKSQLDAVGLNAQIDSMETAAYFKSYFYATDSYDIALMGNGMLDDPSGFVGLFAHTRSGANMYTTDEVDNLWVQLDREMDPAVRQDMGVARIVRAEVLSLRERDFILASEGLGARKSWVITRHFARNVFSPVLVASTNSIASAILTESSLSYLGFGISIPNPSWGGMLEGAQTYILTHPSLAVYPGVCILLTVLCFNVLGNGFRRRFSPNSGR